MVDPRPLGSRSGPTPPWLWVRERRPLPPNADPVRSDDVSGRSVGRGLCGRVCPSTSRGSPTEAVEVDVGGDGGHTSVQVIYEPPVARLLPETSFPP